MIAVVDSGVANLASVMGALKRLNADAEIASDPVKIRKADRVILPGVGAAAPAMAQLKAKKLVDVLRALTQPVLGICLGMQLLFTKSEEGENVPCLGLIKGNVTQLKALSEMPIPHMGWNQIKLKDATHPLLHGIADNSYVYYVHSYAAPESDYTLASTDYGQSFTAIVQKENFFGCQFHPERSSKVGSQILENFLGL